MQTPGGLHRQTPRSRLPPGRGRDWIKVKCVRRQEFIVVGFTKRADAPDGVGALLMGYRRETGGPIFHAGRVGTGWDGNVCATCGCASIS